MAAKTYQDGLTEGKIQALEAVQADHSARLDSHSIRLQHQERITWLILGGLAVLQAFPTIVTIFKTIQN